MKLLSLFIIAILSSAISCATGGKYNYDIKYHPLKSEKKFYEDCEEINYEEIRGDPLKYRGAKLGWFGVVKDIIKNNDSSWTLKLEYRTYQKRHLCEDQLDHSTCRVTVTDRSVGTFTTTITPPQEEAEGRHRINYRSLLKIYGTPTGEYNDEGGPVLECFYYRHWPAGTYVTTKSAYYLRQ